MYDELDDIKILADDDIQTINLDLNTPSINDNSLGIELLADPKKSVKIDGYNSGDDFKTSPKKEEYNFFNNDNDIKDFKIDDPISFGNEQTKKGF